MTELRFVLNGEPRTVRDVPPTATVLDWLRVHARMTGTKEGCAEGDCGACTIVVARDVDGAPRFEAVNSCLMLLPQLDGRAVLTVEGLAPAGALHPVQQAMIEADATQCGFCTPGFVMAMFAFRQGGEPPEDALIHEALAGNLCRCTGYRSIVDACRKVAGAADAEIAARTAEALRGVVPTREYRRDGQIFLAPRTLDELTAAKAAHPDALVLAGGTDLGLRASKDREEFPAVISTANVEALHAVAVQDGALAVGGAATYTEVLPHLDAHFPAFAGIVRRIGSRQIRNLGTLAGNLANASPIGDTIPCLIALDASVTLASPRGARDLRVEDFITGYRKTALAHNEVIAAIRIPLLAADAAFAAYKVSKRFDQDISTVVAAFVLTRDGGRVRDLRAAFGGMAARAMRATNVEAALAGREWTQAALADIDSVLARDFSPLTDHRGGAAYRLRAAAGLLRRFRIETTSATITRVEAL